MADDGNTKVGGLQIEITANSTKAASAITKLTDALEKLSNVKFESSQLEKIADKLSALGNVKISKNLSTRLTEIGKSMEGVSDDALARLDRATDSLKKLAGVDLRGVGSAIRSVLRETTGATGSENSSTDVSGMTQEDRSDFCEERKHDTDELGEAAKRASVNTDKLTESIQNAELQSMRANRAYEEMERRLEVLQSIKGFTNSDQYVEAAARVREYADALDRVREATEAYQRDAESGSFTSEDDVSAAVEQLKELRRQATIAGESAKYAIKDAETSAKSYTKTLGEASSTLKDFAKMLANDFGDTALVGIKSIGKALRERFTAPVKNATNAINKWKSAIGRIAFYRIIRSAIKEVTDGFRTGIENLYQYSRLTNTEFAPAMDRLATSSLYLKNSLGAMAAPLIQAVAPAVDFLVDKFVSLLNIIGKVMAALTGKSVYSQAKKYATEYADAADKASGATKEFQKYLIGIDELNIINDPNGGGGAGGALEDYASMFEEAEVPIEYADWAKEIRDAIENGDWYGAGAALADKLNDLIANADFYGWGKNLGEKIQHGIEFALGFMRKLNWQGLGAGLADFLNGLISEVNPNDLGALLASKIQAGIEFAYGFVTTFRWDEFGDWLGDVVNGWFAEIDWAMLGETISEGIKGTLTSLKRFLNKVEWEQIGEDIAEMLNEIDWFVIFMDALSVAGGIGKALAEAIIGALKKTDWNSFIPDTAGIVGLIGLATFLKALLHPLKTISKLKGLFKGNDAAGVVKEAAKATKKVSVETSSLTPKLTDLAKNLGLGVAIIGEVAAAAVLIVGAIAVLGWELDQVGKAWEPVLNNGETVATAIGIGTGILVTIGAATYALGSAGKTMAANIGIGTAILAEIGLATGLFLVEIWAVGKGLYEIGKAWQPVLDNGEAIAKGIGIGTGLLAGIGVVTAALGAVTVASGFTLPIAIGIGAGVLFELSAATVGFIDNLSSVADELTNRLAPSLEDLNAELPTLTQNMGDFKDYMEKFAGFVADYTKSESVAALTATGGAIVDFFTADPFNKLSKDVDKTYGYTQTLNENLNLAVPELETAVGLLTDYKEMSDQIAEITNSQSGSDFDDDFFINMKNAGKNIVLGLADGISDNANKAVSAIETLSTDVQTAVSTMESEVSTDFTSISTSASKSVETVKSKMTSAFNTVSSSVQKSLSETSASATTYFDTIERTAINSSNKMLEQTTGAWVKAKDIILGTLSSVQSAVSNTFNSIVNSARSWGQDIASNIANGIRDNSGLVTVETNAMADTIRSRLHFSEPDDGPLSDFHTYMPDMLKLMAKGIRDNAHLAVSAVSDLARSVSSEYSTMNMEAPRPGFFGGNGTQLNNRLAYAGVPNSSGSYEDMARGANQEVISVILAAAQQIVRAINDKDTNTYIDGDDITDRVARIRAQQDRMTRR